MALSKRKIFRFLDTLLLLVAFLAQSIILSQYTVYPKSKSEVNCVNPVYQKLLWLTGDLICISGLLIASVFGYTNSLKERNSNLVQPSKYSCLAFISSEKVPLSYISWFLYSTFLFIKVCVIFTSTELIERLKESVEDHEVLTFGDQFLQLGIGLAAIVFSMLVEAHHDSRTVDPKKNAYINSISYEVALEVLDTVCLLSYLSPSFEHEKKHLTLGEPCPATRFTPVILMLAAFNLVLPTILLYKLSATKFGEIYHVKLEMTYKCLHLLLVNVPFFIVRMCLWNTHDREEVIFSLKNIYGIVSFFRGIHADYKILLQERTQTSPTDSRGKNRRQKTDGGEVIASGDGGVPIGRDENIVEMKSLMRSPEQGE